MRLLGAECRSATRRARHGWKVHAPEKERKKEIVAEIMKIKNANESRVTAVGARIVIENYCGKTI
jgi:hypothetical protein